ncbi:MAG: c-type cytochrome [Planctomycetes bacterium]|nr:c-type cytochrome [Planctomycetota bacterium]
MSDAHDPHGAHAPEPAEITNPFLWTAGLIAIAAFLVWLFFQFMGEGRIAARGEPPVRVEQGQQSEPDHAKLAADKSQEVIDKGQQLYVKQCAACHGLDGQPVAGAGSGGVSPRNFHKDAFKNPNGGGPYGIYSVISHGYGAMPAVLSVDPVGRYAIAHYIRETWVKKDSPQNYIEQDKVALPKGGGAKAEKQYPPNEQPVPATLYSLMQVTASQADADARQLATWLAAAGDPTDATLAIDARRLTALVERRQQLGSSLYQAARGGDQERFIALLTAADSPGTGSTDFALMPTTRLAALFTHARKAAGADR